MKKRTLLHDAAEMVGQASHAFIADDFSDSFKHNLPSCEMTFLRIIGMFIRYVILFPLKITLLLVIGLKIYFFFWFSTYFKCKGCIRFFYFLFMKLIVFVLNIRIKHHGVKQHYDFNHIYVANHTSLIDFIVVSSYKFDHSCITEYHGGLFGWFIDKIVSKNGSIYFKRSDKLERQSVLKKITELVQKRESPLIIFSEGTCVNNTCSLMFQRGAFDVNAAIVPVGLKYKVTKQINPYWNRRKLGLVLYLFYLITRSSIDVEVHWMPPIKPGIKETPVSISHRVKKIISDKLGLINKPWNGYFKSLTMKNDFDLLSHAYKNVYKYIREGRLEDINKQDLKNGMSYLQLYKPNDFYYSKIIYFNQLRLSEFINEWCKEYLRLKTLPAKERDIIITNNISGIHISPHLRNMKFKGSNSNFSIE